MSGPRRMGWEEHVVHWGEEDNWLIEGWSSKFQDKKHFQTFSKKSSKKKNPSLKRCRHKSDFNTEMEYWEVRFVDMNWIEIDLQVL